jgi:hypothetical protein
MNVIKKSVRISLLCVLAGLSHSALALVINVNLHSNVEVTTSAGALSHNQSSADSVYSYVDNNESYCAVQAANGNGLINADAFLHPSISTSEAHTTTEIHATLSQKALITNSLADAQAVSFDFLIAAGHLSNIFRSGLGAQDDEEYLSIEFCADILLNGVAIWSTKAGLLQNKSTRIDYEKDNLLTKSGIDLNTEMMAGASDGFYSWGENAGRLDLGIIAPGEAFELEYSVGLIVSGKRKNCDGDFFLCEEERLYNTASQVRFGDEQLLKGMKMDNSTIFAKALSVPEPAAWMLMLVSLFGLSRKVHRKKISV